MQNSVKYFFTVNTFKIRNEKLEKNIFFQYFIFEYTSERTFKIHIRKFL